LRNDPQVHTARLVAIAVAALTFLSCGEREVTPPPGQNRLAFETSPYLLQHKDNPVDWYPWGEEAFEKAKAEDKPLLVSIGYSSCHWCHVMEHESFENPEIAALMNELFVNVKVDREERPDVDEIYMTATQLMGQGGGWPLNVFVTPEGVPFFGGTYFPPSGGQGRPGWPDVLRRISQAWREQRDKIDEQNPRVLAALQGTSVFEAQESVPEVALLDEATGQLATRFDEVWGGFGGAPKFPPSQALQLLMRRYRRTSQPRDLEIVDFTLRKMAHGGMYDQLGGGFHRYSVDQEWLVPHFEKMLYDNALLSRAYVEAYQLTGDAFFGRIARETLDYVLREMTEPEGGFRSATDADSEGREGVYFVWKKAEIEGLLGDDAARFMRAYGVTEEGNFEDVHHPRQPGEQGMNVLHVAVEPAELAKQDGITLADLEERLARGREVLFEHRQGRIYPGLDDKVLTAWNGLMISSMAYAGRALGEPRYVEAAERAADFVLRELRTDEGRLLRTHRGGESKIPGFLDDYAFFAYALLDLYEATFDLRWFEASTAIADEMNRLFWDENGGWFHTATDGEPLIMRMKGPTDGAVPGGNSVATRLLIRLATMTGNADYLDRAERTIRLYRQAVERIPGGTIGFLLALDILLHQDGEVAFVGDPGEQATRALIKPVHEAFLPGTVLALLDPQARARAEETIPLLAGKTLVDGDEAVYVCQNFACQAPVTTVDALEKALALR
jgi:uncharacterized protein YyaL (SSP411 family)